MKKFESIEEYFSAFPKNIQQRLKELRTIIRQVAPEATEKISYNMPAFYLNGNLVYYGAFTNHISLFPHGSVTTLFKEDLKNFVTSKGTIQFQHDQKLPAGLIKKIIKFRVQENKLKLALKKK